MNMTIWRKKTAGLNFLKIQNYFVWILNLHCKKAVFSHLKRLSKKLRLWVWSMSLEWGISNERYWHWVLVLGIGYWGLDRYWYWVLVLRFGFSVVLVLVLVLHKGFVWYWYWYWGWKFRYCLCLIEMRYSNYCGNLYLKSMKCLFLSP